MEFKNIFIAQALVFLVFGLYLTTIDFSNEKMLGISGKAIAGVLLEENEKGDYDGLNFLASFIGFTLITLSILELILFSSTFLYRGP